MEYLAKGSLLTMLQQEGDALGIKFLLKAAYDISLGMEYLAGKQVNDDIYYYVLKYTF